MLCRDGELVFGCDVEVSTWYLVVHIRRTRKAYKLELSAISDITYEELSGKLTITLEEGRTIEVQPQVTEDRDAVSKMLTLFTILKTPSVLDYIGQVLKDFLKSVNAVLRLVSALYETDYGIDWKRILELAEGVAGMAKSSEEFWVGSSKEGIYYLLDSASRRDVKGILGYAKNIVASLYDSAKLCLAKMLPGTTPEVLLDVVLVAILNSTLSMLKVSLSEKEVVNLDEVVNTSLKRFANVMSVEESAMSELRVSIRSKPDIEELVNTLVEVLRKSYLSKISSPQEKPHRS